MSPLRPGRVIDNVGPLVGGLVPSPDIYADYGIQVMSKEFPSLVEVAEAIETAVGSGAYGSFATVGSVPAVGGDWTRWTGRAAVDGKRRQLKARHVKDGTTASAYTSVVTVTPGTASAPPAIQTYVDPSTGKVTTALLDQTGRIVSSDQRFRAQVKLSADYTGLTSTVTYNILFDTEVSDPFAMHDNASNTDRLTIPTGGNTGFWLVKGRVEIEPNGAPSGSTFTLILGSNTGNFDADFVNLPSPSAASTLLKVSTLVPVPAVGDWYRLAINGVFSAGAPKIKTTYTRFEAFHLF